MGRDPNDPGSFDSNGVPTEPKRLHKYLYAGGDPVDAMDPTGRDLAERTGQALTIGLVIYAGIKIDQCNHQILNALNGALSDPLNHSRFQTDWGEVLGCQKEYPWHATQIPGLPLPKE